jgi:hypothetical protein
MNLWQCDRGKYADNRCSRTAVGTGGAVGLRAIGWWFEPGYDFVDRKEHLLCPQHRPDAIPCLEAFLYDTTTDEPCGNCSGEIEADKWQKLMNEELGFGHHSYADWLESQRIAKEGK